MEKTIIQLTELPDLTDYSKVEKDDIETTEKALRLLLKQGTFNLHVRRHCSVAMVNAVASELKSYRVMQMIGGGEYEGDFFFERMSAGN